MGSQGAVKCKVSHLAEPEETMLTKSLIYPIAAVTSTSFWRWTEKLEWMRWTLAWEKRGWLCHCFLRSMQGTAGNTQGGQSKTVPTALLLLAAPMAQRSETPPGDLLSELSTNELSRACRSSCTSHGSRSPLSKWFLLLGCARGRAVHAGCRIP